MTRDENDVIDALLKKVCKQASELGPLLGAHDIPPLERSATQLDALYERLAGGQSWATDHRG